MSCMHANGIAEDFFDLLLNPHYSTNDWCIPKTQARDNAVLFKVFEF